MKTISKYTIFCTETQANKALKLGAQIDFAPMVGIICDEIGKSVFLHGGNLYWLPTAEQMLGWLEEQESIKSIVIDKTDYWQYVIWSSTGNCIWCDTNFKSRKEATLAGIDAALDYLIQNKK